MNQVTLKLIGGIILEGLKIWSMERARKFKKDHHQALKELDNAINNYFPIYTDAERNIAEEELDRMLEAYHVEQKKQNENILNNNSNT